MLRSISHSSRILPKSESKASVPLTPPLFPGLWLVCLQWSVRQRDSSNFIEQLYATTRILTKPGPLFTDEATEVQRGYLICPRHTA